MNKQTNILLVDDSRHIIAALQVLLSEEKDNREIVLANSLKTADAILRSQKIDVVVLDINLPDGSGLELLRKIKSEQPAIIVMMLSNNSDNFHRVSAKSGMADYFFDKSLEFEDAINTISKVVKN